MSSFAGGWTQRGSRVIQPSHCLRTVWKGRSCRWDRAVKLGGLPRFQQWKMRIRVGMIRGRRLRMSIDCLLERVSLPAKRAALARSGASF